MLIRSPPAPSSAAGRRRAAAVAASLGPGDPVQHPAEQQQQPEHDRGDDRVRDARQVAGDAGLQLALEDLGLVDERALEARRGAHPGGRDRRVLGQVDRNAGHVVVALETDQRLPRPVNRDRLGGLIDAGPDPLERVDDQAAALPGDRLQPVGVVADRGRVEAHGRVHGALRARADVVEGHPRVPAARGLVADVEADDGDDRERCQCRRERPAGRRSARGASQRRRTSRRDRRRGRRRRSR